MSQHISVTIPIVLIFAGIALSSLLPDWKILETLLPSSQAYKWQIPVIQALTTVILFLVPYFVHQRFSQSKYTEEKRILFSAALGIIKARTRLAIDLINEFKAIFEKNKYFIKPAQEKVLLSLISDLGDIRSIDEELKPDSAITPEDRKKLVGQRRDILDRVEDMESTIENYLRKIT